MSALAVVLAVASSLGAGPSPVVLEAGADHYPVVGHAELLVDPDRTLDLDAASAAAGWQPIREAHPNFGFSASAFWVRLRVHNPGDVPAHLVFAFRYPLLDEVDVYLEDAAGGFDHLASGDRVPFSGRPIRDTSLAFPVTTAPQHLQWIYARVRTDSSVQLAFSLDSREGFIERAGETMAIRGFYYGLLGVMAAYNLFLFIAIRDRRFLYYVLYVVTLALAQMGMDGVSHRFLLPEHPELANRFTPLAIAVANPWPILFTMAFLDTKRHLPRVHPYVRGYMLVTVTSVAVALVAPYPVAVRFSSVFIFITSFLCAALGVAVLRAGYRPARYFLVAFATLLVSTIVFAGTRWGFVPSNLFTLNFMLVGSALEVTLLSFAVGDQLSSTEREREQARAEAVALEKDLALTAAVQHSFLPAESRVDHGPLRLVGRYRPATHCGGDWWCCERLPDGRLLVLLGDVTGHGAAAAMVTAAIAAAYRLVPVERRGNVDELVTTLSDSFVLICGPTPRMTLAALELDPKRGVIRFFGAGAPAALIMRREGAVEGLGASGMPLGHQPLRVGQAEAPLRPGDRVLLFSDGVTELVRANGRPLGYGGLRRILMATRAVGTAEACEHLDLAVERERGDRPADDDITFVVVDVGEVPAGS